MKKQILKSYLGYFSLLSLLVFSCSVSPSPPTNIARFSLKGNQEKNVTLYGQNYTFKITKIEDFRCTMNSNALGLYGIRVYLSVVKGQSELKQLELFSSRCDKRNMEDTLTFFDSVKATTSMDATADVWGITLGFFDATPLQKNSAQVLQYPLSEYEIFFITKK